MKEQKEEKKFKIICIKAPRWMVPFLKRFYKNKEKEN